MKRLTLVHARYIDGEGREEYRLVPKGAEPDEIEVDGRTFRRPAAAREFRAPAALKKTVMPFASTSLPKWWPYAPRHDAKGRCLFNGRREVEAACAKARAAGEWVVYDY